MRSPRGLMSSRERSKSAYLLAIGEQRAQQLVVAGEVRDDEVCAHARQPVALPWIHAQALRLVRGHAHGNTADLLHVFDFHVPVAETQELVALALGRRDQPLDQDLLGETLVIVERAEDAALEIFRYIEQIGLVPHIL